MWKWIGGQLGYLGRVSKEIHLSKEHAEKELKRSFTPRLKGMLIKGLEENISKLRGDKI